MNIRSERARRRTRPPRLRGLSLNRLLPNMLTMLALCAGVTAMRFAIQGRFEAAVVSIMVAAVLDALDGRIARMLNGQSKFGEELDSLSDVVSFGVVDTTDAAANVPRLPSVGVRASGGRPMALRRGIDLHFDRTAMTARLNEGRRFVIRQSAEHLKQFKSLQGPVTRELA